MDCHPHPNLPPSRGKGLFGGDDDIDGIGVVRQAGGDVEGADIVPSAGVLKVGCDELRAAAVVQGLPNRHRLRGEHAVRVDDMELGARLEYPVDFPKDLDGLDHILDGDGYHGGVQAAIFKRQDGIGIKVVYYAVVQLRVFRRVRRRSSQALSGDLW